VATQHTPYEHNEANDANTVDEAVVEQQDILETSVDTSSSSEAENSTSEFSHDDPFSAPAALSDELSMEQPSTMEETIPVFMVEDTDVTTPEAAIDSAHIEEVQAPLAYQYEASPEETGDIIEEPVAAFAQAEQITPETVDAVAAPLFVDESVAVVAEVTSLPETSEETSHPFTSFIEEFRQAQAHAEAQAEAHINASLQEPQAETFAEFASPETNSLTSEQPVTLEEVLPPVDFGEGSAFIPAIDDMATVDTADAPAQSLDEAVLMEENQRVVAASETKHEEEAPATPTAQRQERPVSPLLRPAQRLRLPRHGSTRHRDESAASATPANASLETPIASPEVSADSASEQIPETPKPPRRYRFDRPAQQAQQAQPVSKPAQATSVPSNNGIVLTPPPATQPTPTFARTEESQTTTPEVKTPTASIVGTPTPEQQSGEPATMESTSTISSPGEQGRRRQHLERHREKEQTSTPASLADIAATLVTESKANAEDVAPEDLPPLEYAELQKANSRRRRRHRTTNGTSVPKETVVNTNNVQQTVQPPPQSAAPLAPAAPIVQNIPQAQPTTPIRVASPADEVQAAANPYTIVSGYTVGQMNQGNEASGPFMGPEPSPARGSVNTTRDGRTVRVESQPQRTTYPAGGTATGASATLPAASMNHFANLVSQAIQTQTDRMVTELRRANQSPTNVSVSLPPFPSTERVGVFVDVANLLYSARTQRIAIDFGKLLDFLRGNRRLVRAHAYCPTSPQPGDEQMFLTAVKGLGYRITTKNYKTFASGAKKADLDLDLCMDVVRLVDGAAVDCIVLVSGDSDFMPMLDYCSDHGVRVEVAAFDEAMSATLRQSCDLFVNLSMLEEIRA